MIRKVHSGGRPKKSVYGKKKELLESATESAGIVLAEPPKDEPARDDEGRLLEPVRDETGMVEGIRVAAYRMENGRAVALSVVDQFKLGNIVSELRLKGKSYKDIASHINSENLLPNNYTISSVAISNWCRNHHLGGDFAGSDTIADEAINIYKQECKALELVATTINMISVHLDTMTQKAGTKRLSVAEVSKLVNSLDKMTARQQSLLTSIGEMQERVYRYEAVSKVITRVMEKVSMLVDADQYRKIKDDVSNDPYLVEALRKIAPANL